MTRTAIAASSTASRNQVQGQSATDRESREPLHQSNPLREVLPIAAHPLPAYDRALDDYTWVDRSAEAITPLMEAAYQEMMHWRPNLFVPPVGNAANDLVNEMTQWITNFIEKTAFERIFLHPHLVLQLPASRLAAAKCKAMSRRMEMWGAGKIEDLLEEGRAIQERVSTTQNDTGKKNGFVRLILSCQSSAAMRLLRKGSSKMVLSLDDCLEGETERDILHDKHPSPTDANSDFIEKNLPPRWQLGHPVLI